MERPSNPVRAGMPTESAAPLPDVAPLEPLQLELAARLGRVSADIPPEQFDRFVGEIYAMKMRWAAESPSRNRGSVMTRSLEVDAAPTQSCLRINVK